MHKHLDPTSLCLDLHAATLLQTQRISTPPVSCKASTRLRHKPTYLVTGATSEQTPTPTPYLPLASRDSYTLSAFHNRIHHANTRIGSLARSHRNHGRRTCHLALIPTRKAQVAITARSRHTDLGLHQEIGQGARRNMDQNCRPEISSRNTRPCCPQHCIPQEH
jgi:hypothetical protein